jgi:plasmid replication initiation protein
MKEDRYLEIRHETVRKKNELIQQGCFNLSVQQQKIILYLIAQISPKDTDFKVYEFTISEFCKTCGITYNGRIHQDLKKSVDEITKARMWISLENGTDLHLGWIDWAEIPAGEGIIKIKLNDRMRPFLLQLKRSFTTYELLWTLNFRSKYTIRLYEYIKSIHYHKDEIYIKDCALDTLRIVMGAEKYKAYKSFKQWALVPAIEEINQYSDESLQYEELRQGRRVVEIRFTISPKERWEVIKLKGAIEDKFELNQLTIWERLSDSST